MKVSQVIYTAFRYAGVLTMPRREPSPSEVEDAYEALNAMVEAWTLEHLMIYQEVRTLVQIMPGKAAYSIGTGGDFDVPRPGRIERAGILQDVTETPLEPLTSRGYQGVAQKSFTSPLPDAFHYEPSYPLGTVHMLPVPSEARTVALYLWRPLAKFDSVYQDVLLPAGYLRALNYNLACELYPMFPRAQINPKVEQTAIESKAWVKSFNIAAIDNILELPAGLPGTCGAYDIYGDR